MNSSTSHPVQPYKVAILCGGIGTRLKEETEFKPKPLVEIGGKPILYHIMKIYSHFGFRKFVLCLGYKGEMIVDYFTNYIFRNNDFKMSVADVQNKSFFVLNDDADADVKNWEITFAYTGKDTQTGGRIKRIERYIQEDLFLATYGDGLANVNILQLLQFHKKMGKTATLTGVHMPTTFGVVEDDGNGLVRHFREKPVLADRINGGFFVFNRSIFDYIKDDQIVLENEPLRELVSQKQLCIYQHEAFWQCMDTFKDFKVLNSLWDSGNPPWYILG